MTERTFDQPLERLVLTAAAQRDVDAAAERAGVSSLDLMESAGRSAAEWILDRLRPSAVLVLAGPGGNGGDALVVARRLAEAGVEVRTFLLAPADRLGVSTRTMLDRLRAVGERPGVLAETAESELDEAISRSAWVVDGLFGSGTTRPLDGAARDTVVRLDASGARVVSLDLPSGLSADGGALLGKAVRADITLAMAFLKPAHLLHPASATCGNVAVVPVAYPSEVLDGIDPWARVAEPAGIARRLPRRRPDGHKGTFGRVVVVAGSLGMTGAAILTCRAALRAGAGLVTLGAPASLQVVFDLALPEVIVLPLPDEGGHVAGVDDGAFASALDRADVLALGPGLSRAPATGAAVRDLVRDYRGPIVLDADGIAAFAERPEMSRDLGARLLLTPHPGELGLLLGREPDEIDADRVEAARTFVRESGHGLLLKGRPTVIGRPDGRLYLNPTGNTGLATGGSGDVLTGLIAGFVAGGASLDDAAVLSAYLHGWAAEVYARDRAERSLMPSDLLDLLPEVLREVETWI
jgi:hydroxyethylthiazole kinase-like uncharacterized protein yjeF